MCLAVPGFSSSKYFAMLSYSSSSSLSSPEEAALAESGLARVAAVAVAEVAAVEVMRRNGCRQLGMSSKSDEELWWCRFGAGDPEESDDEDESDEESSG